ncbi:SDR family oxidoreductase [Antrihabitans sp. YC2-6]|uniref:SDR family oxidoreductase n=1 Tax=Antrihabitans sp. YC2-6 TaxID=2799498 RepID=UPI0018F473A8|nr:SDR family oxidoreductase [Antrihabitans sp. YC2-6]MBJ8347480.1 SDR family oxidoreductase [Antrihabitans sp. YC2-6]
MPRFVQSGDLQIAVYEQGNPEGETVVLFHGWPDSHHLWSNVVPHLTDRFRVITVDSRGHGASSNPEGEQTISVEELASDFRAVIDAVSPDAPVHLIAHDWGSVASWEVVCEPGAEERIKSFTSLSGPSVDHLFTWLRSRLSRPTPRNIALPLGQVGSLAYMVAFASPVGSAVFGQMKANRWKTFLSVTEGIPADRVELAPTFDHDIVSGLRIYKSILAKPFSKPRERHTDVPVQVLIGTRDPAVRQSGYADEDKWVDKVWLRVVKGGHWLPYSHPELVASSAIELIDTVGGAEPARGLRRATLGAKPGEFEDKLVVITGGGSGIGRQTALAFARKGAEIVLSDVNIAAAKETANLIADEDGIAHAYQLDVSDAQAVQAHADEVIAQHGVPDVLINNAGIGQAGDFLDTSEEEFRKVLEVNLFGVANGCRAFLGKMVERGDGGHIVNLSSMAAFSPQQGFTAYATSKSAVFMFSDCLRAELSGSGIGVSTICPGIVHTNIVASTRFSGVSADEEAAKQKRYDKLYEKRGYGPEKVAAEIVAAVQKNKSIVPVTPEAHAQYHFARLLPGAARFVAARAKLIR